MAAAMAQQRFPDRIRTDFAGMEKTAALDETMVQYIQKRGLDLGYRRPQSPEEALFGLAPDLVVVIGDVPGKGPHPGVGRLHWPLPTDDQSMEALRLQIHANLDQLIERIQ